MTWYQKMAAVMFFVIGFHMDPFDGRTLFYQPDSAQVTRTIGQIEAYLRVGNVEGAKAKIEGLRKMDPQNPFIGLLEKKLAEARPQMIAPVVGRLPSSLRDVIYDSVLIAQSGQCQKAKEGLKPVRRYLASAESDLILEKVAKLCSEAATSKSFDK